MIIAKKNATNYEPVPQGTHCARIYQIIHIGTVSGYEGKLQNKVRITFELPNETKEFVAGEGQKPYSISREYTLSFHEKAPLRALVEACVGPADGDMEYEIENLLGKSCLINIKHKISTKDGGTYANVGTASPLPKGMICPPAVNPPRVLSFDKFDQEFFAGLPDFIREKIKSSEEYRKMGGETNEVPF